MLGNGLIEKMTPNARLQPLKIELGSAAVSDEVGSFTFGYSGSTCVAGQTWANNGNVVSQAIKVGASTFTQSYGYDGLNRLTCAKEGTAWEQRYGLDVYGNRWLTVNTLPTTSALTATAKSNFNAANNRLITSPTGGSYDAVGNLLRLSGGTGAASVSHDLTYDGENRVVQSNNQGVVTNFVYDGFGRRVQAGGRVFVYFPDGKLAMEATGANSKTKSANSTPPLSPPAPSTTTAATKGSKPPATSTKSPSSPTAKSSSASPKTPKPALAEKSQILQIFLSLFLSDTSGALFKLANRLVGCQIAIIEA